MTREWSVGQTTRPPTVAQRGIPVRVLHALRGLYATSQAFVVSVFPYFAIWLFATFATVYMKWNIMCDRGFWCVGRALGRSRNGASPTSFFDFFERLSFFRSDLLLGVVVLPSLAVLVLWWIPRRWRMPCVIFVTFLAIVFLYLQMHGYWVVGQFQSCKLWYESIKWGLWHPEDAETYAGAGMPLKIGMCLIMLVAVGTLLKWTMNRAERASSLTRLPAMACLVATLALTGASWYSNMESTAYHRSALWTCLRTFLGIDDIDVARYNSLSRDEALARWRKLTSTPEPKPASDHFGVAKDYDVVCFVFETAPARCLDVNGNLDDLPNLKRLREHAWISPNHVTTYPYTSCALFSLLTSWYPTDMRFLAAPGRSGPGFMQSLRQQGYETAAYLPFSINQDEEVTHHAVGISRIVVAETGTPNTESQRAKPWQEKFRRDKQALERMKQDLLVWMRANQRYAVIYLPQIGHAPWADVTGDGMQRDLYSRGRALIAIQDRWLGEILATLESAGRLDRTIILVTGDHGTRTVTEDPEVVGGMICPCSFRVPCLLSVPQALRGTVVIPWTTSHIDLSPSILDVLGVGIGRDCELGSPMWDDRIRQRTTFFWANAFLGADGFCEKNKYYMWQHLSDMMYFNTSLDFKADEPLAMDSPISRYVREKITDAMALQFRLTRLSANVTVEPARSATVRRPGAVRGASRTRELPSHMRQ